VGRRILITGAAGGVGHATAELLAAEGASVALADIRADALEAAAAAIRGDAFARTSRAGLDHRPRDEPRGLVGVIHADPLETAWMDWERIFRINLFGATSTSSMCRANCELTRCGKTSPAACPARLPYATATSRSMSVATPQLTLISCGASAAERTRVILMSAALLAL
jgi:NAD(P)-dependent dehydrogenase (short-subunit alcohol dehydrogenase family)